MKPIISGSGTGKNTYMTKFFVNNIYDKIVSCAYFGTNFDYENMSYMLNATNNPILLCDKLKNITLSFNGHEIGDLGLGKKLERAEAVSLLTTAENNFFSIENAALVPATLSSFRYESEDQLDYYLIQTHDNHPIVFGVKQVQSDILGDMIVISTPIWSDPSFFCDKFKSELPCCIYLEGVCTLCTKVITRKIIERPRFVLDKDESDFLDFFCSKIGAERSFSSPKAVRIPIISRSTWDSKKYGDMLTYENYLKGARLYNKALRSFGGDSFEYDPTKVNESFDTLVYFDKSGSHRLNFNPYRRILDSNSTVFVDSLTCLLWSDVGNQPRSKGGVPTDLLTTIQTTTFSNVRPLYVPNPAFDPFGGASFNEMIGGTFVSNYAGDGFIGSSTWIGDRREGRRTLMIDTHVIILESDDGSEQSLLFAIDNENKTIIVKLFAGEYFDNDVIDFFVSTDKDVFTDFKNSAVTSSTFDISNLQTYDLESFPKSYKAKELLDMKGALEFLIKNSSQESPLWRASQKRLEEF